MLKTRRLFFRGFYAVSAIALGLLIPMASVGALGDYTWTTANGLSSAICGRVAASSTGQYMACANAAGGDIYTSSDYGANWTDQTGSGSQSWENVAVSGNGKYMVADYTGGDLWISSDYGVTWVDHAVGGISGWDFAAISATGQYIDVANSSNNTVYLSQDYGASWTTSAPLSSADPISVAMSDNGQNLTVAYNGGDLYTSSDYGANWTDRTSAGSHTWTSLSMSQSGQYIAAASSDGFVLRSPDYGVTWDNITPNSGAPNWNSVLISNDGQSVLANQYYFSFMTFSNAGDMYESYDAGATWAIDTSLPVNAGWSAMSGSGDRSRLVVRNMGDNNVYVGVNPALYVAPTLADTGSSTNPSTTTTTAAKAPNTGYGMPADSDLVETIVIVAVSSIGVGLSLVYRRKHTENCHNIQ